MRELMIQTPNSRWQGWQRFELLRSMETAADEFTLALSEQGAATAQQTLSSGEPVQLQLGNELLSTGFIDAIKPEYSADKLALSVTGRSRLGDLVDCATEGKQFLQQSFINIARDLCAPFGIDVIVAEGVNANTVLNNPAIDEGQPIFEFLEREARALALRLMGTPEGNLLITQLGTATADALVLGENVLGASADFDMRERFSEYTVVSSQSRIWAQADAKGLNLVRGTARDESISRHRPLVILADEDLDQAKCERRARFQKNTHFGRGQGIEYKVAGWQQKNGKVWQPNTLSTIKDHVLGINEQRVITEVRLTLDETGRHTELTVLPKQALNLEKLPPQQDQRLWK